MAPGRKRLQESFSTCLASLSRAGSVTGEIQHATDGMFRIHFYPLLSLQEKIIIGDWKKEDSSHNMLRKTKIIPTWKSIWYKSQTKKSNTLIKWKNGTDSSKNCTLHILTVATQRKENLRFQMRFIFAKPSRVNITGGKSKDAMKNHFQPSLRSGRHCHPSEWELQGKCRRQGEDLYGMLLMGVHEMNST